ncbi:MAG TPA: phosphoribosylamine--glycine ligase [Prolixibacteraceae bacterium]|nr:phosphoribosylamine--glycine ligase [Prolixibacteraceae bacterium]
MNVLIIGSGAREHAMGWKISQSPALGKLYFAPGNPGTANLGVNLSLSAGDFPGIGEAALEHGIGLLLVGPEGPLVEGIADYFSREEKLKHIRVIGPKKSGARLEGSKDFAKEFLTRHHIPTARYASFHKEETEAGCRYLETLRPPYVLKADGLAAGKGVVILESLDEAKAALREMTAGKFGKAGDVVVIEEFLKGIELSVFVVTDGKEYVILPEAKDYKRIGHNDTGLNTGGMGAVSPVPFADAGFMQKVEQRIIQPTIRGIQEDQLDYTGFIFFGLINCGGDPKVIEYNVRMGDPETEAVMLRIESDFLELMNAAATGKLASYQLRTSPLVATTVMAVSQGYPGDFEKGKVISGYDKMDGACLFHAGTRMESGQLTTSGGRVLAVSATGQSRDEALAICYQNLNLISYEGKYFRKDIGFDL